MTSTAILWYRRDLRVQDHPALAAALAAADQVVPVFVVDDILLAGRWPTANRAGFMRESLVALSAELAARGAALRILRGRPLDVLPAFASETGAGDVFLTREATPYARSRDRSVAARLGQHGIEVHARSGLYVHEPDEVVTRAGNPYTVFGPFRRAWDGLPRRAVRPAPHRIPGPRRAVADEVPDLGGPSARAALIPQPGEPAARARLAAWVERRIDGYADRRNRLDADRGTSRLSQDLRFGLLSPVEVLERSAGPSEGRLRFATELAWRDFYAHVLWHHPRVLHEPFQPALATLPWRDDPDALDAWREGRTGYPVVDAAMRQLRESGYVHNRARMIAASFLAKDLLLDWRLGEAEFMRHLTDGDVESNDGGWQWSAGTGTDPQPFLRVFNQVLQGRRCRLVWHGCSLALLCDDLAGAGLEVGWR